MSATLSNKQVSFCKIGVGSTTAPATNLNEIATCALCFQQGIYGKEIVDVDYRDSLGHDSTRCECRDVEACLDRRGY